MSTLGNGGFSSQHITGVYIGLFQSHLGLTNLKEMGANFSNEGKFFQNDNLKILWQFLFNWGHFFKLGANVLEEFENVFF